MPGHRFVFTQANEIAYVGSPATEFDAPEYLDALAEQAIANEGLPPETPYALLTVDDLPPTGRWRNAWRLSGGAVSVNLPAARGLRRDELLREVKSEMARLTAAIDEATDDSDEALAAELRGHRKKLRALDGPAVLAQLAGVSDLGELDTAEPADLRNAKSARGRAALAASLRHGTQTSQTSLLQTTLSRQHGLTNLRGGVALVSGDWMVRDAGGTGRALGVSLWPGQSVTLLGATLSLPGGKLMLAVSGSCDVALNLNLLLEN